jgi:hypothetical protein
MAANLARMPRGNSAGIPFTMPDGTVVYLAAAMALDATGSALPSGSASAPIATVGSRPLPIMRATVANSARTYATTQGLSIGGLITFDAGIAYANVIATALSLRLTVKYSDHAGAAVFFAQPIEGLPTDGSTVITDNALVSIGSADFTKALPALNTSFGGASAAGFVLGATFTFPRMQADSLGRFYTCLSVNAASMAFATANAIYARLDGTV